MCHQSPESRWKSIDVGRGENRDLQATMTVGKVRSREEDKRRWNKRERETKSNSSNKLSSVMVLGHGKKESCR